MRVRVAAMLVAFGISLTGPAFAGPGVLLLADDGEPAWTALVTQLAATVDKQRPTELALWPATNSNLQAAVDRLVGRGVSEIAAVPLFIAAPPDLTSSVKSSVPLRVAAPLNGDPVIDDIVLGRAQEMSRNPGAEVLLLVAHRPAAGDKRWVPDLRVVMERLNRMRAFAMIVTATVPPDAAQAPADEVAVLRRVLEREIARGRQVLVVPVLTSYGGAEAAIRERLQGLSYEVTKSAPMPDDRLVAWIVARADGKSH